MLIIRILLNNRIRTSNTMIIIFVIENLQRVIIQITSNILRDESQITNLIVMMISVLNIHGRSMYF
jgi:hypothetical protein